jgi:ERCC4-related helicase
VLVGAGAGKTLIAAEVIRAKLPSLKAAGKAVLFMAPTNPLVAQVHIFTGSD